MEYRFRLGFFEKRDVVLKRGVLGSFVVFIFYF